MDNRKTHAFAEAITAEERSREEWESRYLPSRQGRESANQPAQFQPSFSSAYSVQPHGSPAQGPPQGPRPPSDPPAGPPSNDSVYWQATRIGTPQNGPLNYPQNVERRVTRQVEVPYTRQVRVPVRRQKVVPTKVQQRILTKRLVEVPTFEVVDEEYTEIMDQPAVRNKEIWVKKVVPEHYMQQVPVKRTRQVTKPTTVIKEVDDYQVVEIDGTKAIEVDGYRIDEVQDTRVVEVDEVQNYRLHPQADGDPRVQDVRDISSNFNQSRRIGTQMYSPNDMRVSNLPDDNGANGAASFARSLPTIRQRAATSIPGARAGRSRRTGTAIPRSRTRPLRQLRPFGFQLIDTGRNDGVLVKRVSPNSVASESGLCANDVIVRVNNRPSRNMEEFKGVISSSNRSTRITVVRGSMGNLKLDLAR